MNPVTFRWPDGRTWIPRFVETIDEDRCIGCGRCVRVCGRNVLELVGVDADGARVAVAGGAGSDDGEYERQIMTIKERSNCIGCEACSRICPKKCYTHAPMSLE